MTKKIAIIGTTTSLVDAPYNDPEWEIWGLNGAYTAVPKYDRWFDLHDLEILKKHHLPAYFDFLANAKNKLMMNKKYDEYPDAEVFPYQDLVDKYGRYFTNTISWLIALALEENPDEIGIWGVNMAQNTEYAKQRPSCEYFLGIAVGRGIKVTIPDASEMLKCTHLYGVEPIPSIVSKLPDKKRELTANYNDVLKNLEDKKTQVQQLSGYAQCLSEFYKFTQSIKDKSKNEFYEELEKYKDDYLLDAKKQMDGLGKEVNTLYDQKSYWEGANDLLNYFNVNWS